MTCSKACEMLSCENCSIVELSVFDIATQKITDRTVYVSSIELDEMISNTNTQIPEKVARLLLKRGLYVPSYLISAYLGAPQC